MIAIWRFTSLPLPSLPLPSLRITSLRITSLQVTSLRAKRSNLQTATALRPRSDKTRHCESRHCQFRHCESRHCERSEAISKTHSNESYKSTHNGLSASINAIFFWRDPPLICFSRNMAISMDACCSNQTSECRRYLLLKPSNTWFLCYQIRLIKSLVTPTYKVPLGLLVKI